MREFVHSRMGTANSLPLCKHLGWIGASFKPRTDPAISEPEIYISFTPAKQKKEISRSLQGIHCNILKHSSSMRTFCTLMSFTKPSALYLSRKACVYVASGSLDPECVAWKPDPFIFWIVRMHPSLLPWRNVDKAFYLKIMVHCFNFRQVLLCYTSADMCRPLKLERDEMMLDVFVWNWIFFVFSFQEERKCK